MLLDPELPARVERQLVEVVRVWQEEERQAAVDWQAARQAAVPQGEREPGGAA